MTAAQTQTQSLPARRHVALRYLLKKCLRLEPHHMKALRIEWNADTSRIRRMGFRSAPQNKYHLMFIHVEMEKFIDLQGIAGFYVELHEETGACRWKFNAPSQNCILRPFRDANELIQGLLVYRNAKDEQPFLLSSSGLLFGSKATNFNPLIHH